jgi:hypothetical protein
MNEKSFGSKILALPQFFKSSEDEKVRTIQAGLKFFQPVCLYLCQFRVLNKSGLPKPWTKGGKNWGRASSKAKLTSYLDWC